MRKQPFAQSVLTTAILLALTPAVYAAPPAKQTQAKQAATARDIERIEILGQRDKNGYRDPEMASATGMNLSTMETPQSVFSISSAMINDFQLSNINDALEYSSGVDVEPLETDRTYYLARGFEINNFQVDGVGLPLSNGNIEGDIDTAIYQRIDVVMGANGLMAGVGNPSATINMIRKRPTQDLQGNVSLSGGSWDQRRLVGDVSGSLNSSGSVRGRAVTVYSKQNSYLDFYSKEKRIGYGVVEADLTDNTMLTAGYTWQKIDSDSPLWGALPTHYADGTATDYDRSTSTSANWAYWNNLRRTAFVELTHQFANGWQAKLTYNNENNDSNGRLFYMFGNPASPSNPDQGLMGYASLYNFKEKRELLNLTVNGNYSLFGRQHQLTFGGSWAKNDFNDASVYDQDTITGNYQPVGALKDWDGRYQHSAWAHELSAGQGSDYTDREKAVFAATRLNLTDDLSLLVGGRWIDWESKGVSYGEDIARAENGKIIPYAGVVYNLTDSLMAYASYTETFTPQSQIDINRNRLDNSDGINQEIGLKQSLFDGNAIASLALFKAKYNNLAEEIGRIPGTNDTYYEGMDEESEGVELRLSGQLAEGLQASMGYTYVGIQGSDGHSLRPYVPQNSVRLNATYTLPMLEALKVGGSVRWQDSTHRTNSGLPDTRQKAMTVIDVMANYQFTPQLHASLNVKNLTNRKYWSSLYTSQAYYAAPRNFMVTVAYDF